MIILFIILLISLIVYRILICNYVILHICTYNKNKGVLFDYVFKKCLVSKNILEILIDNTYFCETERIEFVNNKPLLTYYSEIAKGFKPYSLIDLQNLKISTLHFGENKTPLCGLLYKVNLFSLLSLFWHHCKNIFENNYINSVKDLKYLFTYNDTFENMLLNNYQRKFLKYHCGNYNYIKE